MSDAPSPKSHGRLTARPSLRPRELMAEPQVAGAWTARIVTLFPEAFPGILGLSLTGKALAQGLWNLRTSACAISAWAGIAMSTTRPRAAGPAWSSARTCWTQP